MPDTTSTSDVSALIEEARERAAKYTGGPEANRLWRLADALEIAERDYETVRQQRSTALKAAQEAQAKLAEVRELLWHGRHAAVARQALKILDGVDREQEAP